MSGNFFQDQMYALRADHSITDELFDELLKIAYQAIVYFEDAVKLEQTAKSHHDTIVRVRELVMKALLQQEQNGGQVAIFPSTILEALDGEK